jgi:hypothetical protein
MGYVGLVVAVVVALLVLLVSLRFSQGVHVPAFSKPR